MAPRPRPRPFVGLPVIQSSSANLLRIGTRPDFLGDDRESSVTEVSACSASEAESDGKDGGELC
ncbi:hypothetical protein DPMN_046720 [Dreissena polymorpha]|uniref:Uncharacterized protein n=1 Tax=Dreissena polymorpha TaxID=45954 RepID=A0A9D4D7D3_DREPO|nr:hypothetical protein DPMN_046720 [Dreissena polymorpha]